MTINYGFLAESELYVSGRKKDMIIVGGKNIYPQDLEALTGEVPGVHLGRTVAFGMYDEEAGTEEVSSSRKWTAKNHPSRKSSQTQFASM